MREIRGRAEKIVYSNSLGASANGRSALHVKYRLPIFLAITIGMFHTALGHHVILYVLYDIFAAAGFKQCFPGIPCKRLLSVGHDLNCDLLACR